MLMTSKKSKFFGLVPTPINIGKMKQSSYEYNNEH